MAATIFTLKHAGYKLGLILLLYGAVVFCVGYATPNWSETRFSYSNVTRYSYEVRYVYNGLWLFCRDHRLPLFQLDIDACVSTIHGASALDRKGWFKAVQGLQTIAIICCLVDIVYAAVLNFLTKRCSFNRFTEAGAVFTVVTGLIGIIIYGAEHDKVKVTLEDEKEDPETGLQFALHILDLEHVSWSLLVNFAGLGIILVAAILIAVFNRPIHDEDATVACHSGDGASCVISGAAPSSASGGTQRSF